MSEFLAEVVGTMILIIFGGGVVAGVVLKDSKAEGSGWIVNRKWDVYRGERGIAVERRNSLTVVRPAYSQALDRRREDSPRHPRDFSAHRRPGFRVRDA